MRTMLKVVVPVEAGNKGIKDGSIAQIIGKFVETWKPEAAYFTADQGPRTALFVLDIKDSSDLPAIAEPFYLALNASITATPCMNAEDLKAGLEKLSKQQ